jgi:hypothetical protein
MRYGMASCGTIYIPTLIKNGIGVEAILRFRLGNLIGYKVGTTTGRDLRRVSLKLARGGMITHTEFHSDQLRHLSNITAITTTI